MNLVAGRRAVAIAPGLQARAEARCDLGPFRAPGGDLSVNLRRGAAVAPRDALSAGGVAYAARGEDVDVRIADDPYAAEAAVRLAYALAFERQGGLLLHAAGIWFPSSGGWLAVGRSGAGKSTLAQHCADAGAEVLSDETVGWLPDGTLWATPFRSTARFPRPPPSPRALAAVVFLEHAPAEQLSPIPADEAVRVMLPQVYRTPGTPILQRAAALVSLRGTYRLKLRNDPAVASFLCGRSNFSRLGLGWN